MLVLAFSNLSERACWVTATFNLDLVWEEIDSRWITTAHWRCLLLMDQFLPVCKIICTFSLNLELIRPSRIQMHCLLVDWVPVHLDGIGEGELVLELLNLVLCLQLLRPCILLEQGRVPEIVDTWALRILGEQQHARAFTIYNHKRAPCVNTVVQTAWEVRGWTFGASTGPTTLLAVPFEWWESILAWTLNGSHLFTKSWARTLISLLEFKF